MSNFWLFFNHGLQYIINWSSYDIVLFLIVLCLSYDFSAWKKLLGLISLFTLSHIISTLLGSSNIVQVSPAVINFLIPLTILFLALYNIFTAGKLKKVQKNGVLYIVAAIFGLVNGLGFSSTYIKLDPDNRFLSLLALESGVFCGQIIVGISIFLIAFISQNFFRINKRDWVLVASSIVLGMLIPMLIKNWIF